MAGRPKATTIVDIAKSSGVSVTTVSRILNDSPDVADETRKRVLRVMEETGFAPHSAWRQIRLGRSRLIAMHVPQEFNPPNLRVILAAALGVEEAGYSINIITRTLSDAELLAIFRSREADGAILLEVLVDDRRAALLRDHGFPFVMVGHCADNTGLSFVDVDIEHGIELAVDHLAGLGHRHIAFLGLDPHAGDRAYGFAVWALLGYERACQQRGFAPLACMGGPTSESMSAVAQEALAAHPEITAFIVPQVQSAIGALTAAKARGMRIPEDLSVVAMLGEAMAELATPPLTTVEFPATEMGGGAARLLLDRLDRGDDEPDHVFFKPGLVVRGSSGPARSQT